MSGKCGNIGCNRKVTYNTDEPNPLCRICKRTLDNYLKSRTDFCADALIAERAKLKKKLEGLKDYVRRVAIHLDHEEGKCEGTTPIDKCITRKKLHEKLDTLIKELDTEE